MRRTGVVALLAIGASMGMACGSLLGIGEDDPNPNTGPSVATDAGDGSLDGVPGDGSALSDASLTDARFDQDSEPCALCTTKRCTDSTHCDPLIFVTQEDYAGDFADVDGDAGMGTNLDKLDEACRRSAAKVGLTSTTFKAWASIATENITPLRLVSTQRPYRLRDGTIVVQAFGRFFDAGLEQRISLTANGDPLLTAPVWTGTTENGQATTRDCSGWSLQKQTDGGSLSGYSGQTTCVIGQLCLREHWTAQSDAPCATRQHIYCLEQLNP